MNESAPSGTPATFGASTVPASVLRRLTALREVGQTVAVVQPLRTPWPKRVVAVVSSRRQNGSPNERTLGPRIDAAVASLDPARDVLSTSMGTPAYDLSCAAALRRGIPLLLTLVGAPPSRSGPTASTSPLSMLPDLIAQSIGVQAVPRGRNRQPSWEARDDLVVALADSVLAVDLRPQGTMADRVERFHSLGSDIEYLSTGERAQPASLQFIMPQMLRWPPATRRAGDADCFLYHYTRGRRGPWPDESYRSYLDDLLDGASPRRSARDSLHRILATGRLEASRYLIRGGVSVVCFTAVPPDRAAELMTHRRGLGRRRFEAYGIGIAKEAIRKLLGRPVRYGDESIFQELPDAEKFLFQRRATGGSRWEEEREWRVPGGIDLRKIDAGQLQLVVSDHGEAMQLERATGLRTHVLGGEAPGLSQPT